METGTSRARRQTQEQLAFLNTEVQAVRIVKRFYRYAELQRDEIIMLRTQLLEREKELEELRAKFDK